MIKIKSRLQAEILLFSLVIISIFTLNLFQNKIVYGQIVSGAEFFIGTDLGEGLGTQLQPTDGAFDTNNEEVSLTGISSLNLAVGEHKVNIRAKDSNGNWGDIKQAVLIISKDALTITAAEFFIGKDPGAGNGTALKPTDGVFNSASEEGFLNNISSSSLSSGSHNVNLRAKDSNGNWGDVKQVTLLVDPSDNPGTSFIIDAEYYIDSDPGKGLGTSLLPTDGVFSSSAEDVFADRISSSELSVGTHKVFVRGNDLVNGWGAPVSSSLTVGSADGVPVQGGTTPLPKATPIPGTTVVPTPIPTPIVEETGIKADFVADITLGSAPLNVQFTDASKGGPTGWFWDFGDGSTATEKKPTNVYKQSGLYTVKLDVSNSFGKNSIEKVEFIDVRESSTLEADFKVDKAFGLVPLKVKFTDLTKGNPTGWVWRFGDGGTNDTQNPEHSYLVDGIFNVELTATKGTDVSIENKINLITATENRPSANFKASATVGQTPFEVKFTDLSQPAGNITSWTWDFADGKSSSDSNPAHTFESEGFFSVELTVSNDTGADSERKTNLIVALSKNVPVAQFKASTTAGLAPLDVKFTDQSEPSDDIASHVWVFGDGGLSTDENPSHSYKNEGIYTVSLTVSNSFGADSEVKPNIVSVIGETDDVIAAFSVNPAIGIVPANIEFVNNSGGTVVEAIWNFGDGIEINEPGSDNVSHTYRQPGVYDISLTVKGSTGNEDIESKSSLIKIIEEGGVAAGFNATPVIGTGPLVVQFIDKSKGEVSSREWDFGDGGAKSTEANPKHTFFKAGKYDVKLIVNSADGKGDSTTRNGFVEVLGDSGGTTTPTPGETPEQILNELIAVPSSVKKSRKSTTVTVIAEDQNGNPMDKVVINAIANGRKTSVTPSSVLTNADGEAEFEVKFGKRKGGSVTFEADGVTATVNQN